MEKQGCLGGRKGFRPGQFLLGHVVSTAEKLFKIPSGNLALEQIWLVLSLAALTSVSEKKPLKPGLGFGCRL